jgi:hypothetical protein
MMSNTLIRSGIENVSCFGLKRRVTLGDRRNQSFVKEQNSEHTTKIDAL